MDSDFVTRRNKREFELMLEFLIVDVLHSRGGWVDAIVREARKTRFNLKHSSWNDAATLLATAYLELKENMDDELLKEFARRFIDDSARMDADDLEEYYWMIAEREGYY